MARLSRQRTLSLPMILMVLAGVGLSSSCGSGGGSTSVSATGVDLVAVEVTPSVWSLEAGSSVVVTAEVANLGPSPSAPFDVGVYLSADDQRDPLDVAVFSLSGEAR